MFTISNDELAKAEPMKAGDKIKCKCGKKHVIRGSKGTGVILYYKCGKDCFMAGLDGKSILAVKT